ncbi:hypothetical protein [Streptomyces sp. NPDC052701]|uniref:hypothetical protein n=1 Tax=Streptomyces sp. NPDC052701 TaxID=3155533 RepID=UPI00342A1FAD
MHPISGPAQALVADATARPQDAEDGPAPVPARAASVRPSFRDPGARSRPERPGRPLPSGTPAHAARAPRATVGEK